MDALRLIVDVDARKKAMLEQAMLVDEGFAYWACRYLNAKLHKETPSIVIMNQELDIQFRTKLPKNLCEAYSKMCEIASLMDNEFSFVFQVALVCVTPQLSCIDFIGAPFLEFTKSIQAPHVSPDLRFEAAIRSVITGEWRKDTAHTTMCKTCDRVSKKPKMSINEFNRHWYRAVDNHPRVVGIMNRIKKEAGIGIPYEPPKPKKGHKHVNLANKMFPLVEKLELSASTIPPEWGIDQYKHELSSTSKEPSLRHSIKVYQQLAMSRDNFLRTMKSEGLI